MLAVSGINKTYGAVTVLRNVSLLLKSGEKAGLIGPNGCGKTTLFKILAGELEAEGGKVRLSRGSMIGYLSQEPEHPDREGSTLQSYLELSFAPLLKIKEQLTALEQEMGRYAIGEPRLDDLLRCYGELSHRFEAGGGYIVDSRIAAVSRGLGFAPEQLRRPLDTFSGGEKTRARLAALLLAEPDLLLLDEPTNFLDQEGLEWLERYLQEWRRTLLVVSHDRFFLDRLVGKIFLIEGHGLKAYRGNYSAFVEQRRLENVTRERAYRKQQAVIADEEKYIREAKGDERSQRQAASRQKKLAGLEPVERPAAGTTFHLKLDYTGGGGRLALSFDRVGKAYGPKEVLRDLSFKIYWGDRAALVGPNGSGKTTLLRLVAGEEEPTRGLVHFGAAVKPVYFSQEQEYLVPERTLLEEISISGGLDRQRARDLLGRYLFRGDDVFKLVGALSGGEKSRLALARLSLEEGNLLLMDEPTSHLDLPALEQLEQALRLYPGTLIVVSHDRYFLKGLVNRVLELERGALRLFNGDFQRYLENRMNREKELRQDQQREEHEQRRALRRQEEAARQTLLRQRRRRRDLEREQAGLEAAIAAAEAKKKELEAALADPSLYDSNHERVRALHRQLKAEQARVSELLGRWETVSLRLDGPGEG